jgi:S1-C subfamily serine protease
MEIERRHRKKIGGVNFLLVILILLLSLFMYLSFIKQDADYDQLNKRITNLQTYTQTKLNNLSLDVLETKSTLNLLSSQVGSMDSELIRLKASTSSDFSGIIEQVIKSVVTIKTNIGQGSGFIISNNSYIVTNEHVIDGASAATAITYDGKTHSLLLIGKNTKMDIALLKIEETNYSGLILENSNSIQVGEKVIAIGNPLGLQFSVSEGIVSAVHRIGENGINGYIQTDASLNPGNSGGPLINKEGKVIGINNFKVNNSENLGFALESNYIKETVNNIYNQVYGKNLI